MKRGIIVTAAKFAILDEKAVTYLRKKGHKLDRWCEKTIHVSDNRLVFRTTEKIEPILTKTEKAEIFELKSDWFPKAEII